MTGNYSQFTSFVTHGQTFVLHPEKAAYWKEKNWLLVSDIHVGKAHHFRKHGFAVTDRIMQADLLRLNALVGIFRPDRVLILGDLSHSEYNKGWEAFVNFAKIFREGLLHLVPGNHDIMDPKEYERAHIVIHPVVLEEGPVIFSHREIDDLPPDRYGISGHVHPGVKLTGKGHQSATLPCFAFGALSGTMPAFGSFTGLHKLKPASGERIYAIAGDQVLDVSPSEVSRHS